jgi:hypothetical protein
MTNKRKKRIGELADKLDVSRRAAANILKSGAGEPPADPTAGIPFGQILDWINAASKVVFVAHQGTRTVRYEGRTYNRDPRELLPLLEELIHRIDGDGARGYFTLRRAARTVRAVTLEFAHELHFAPIRERVLRAADRLADLEALFREPSERSWKGLTKMGPTTVTVKDGAAFVVEEKVDTHGPFFEVRTQEGMALGIIRIEPSLTSLFPGIATSEHYFIEIAQQLRGPERPGSNGRPPTGDRIGATSR